MENSRLVGVRDSGSAYTPPLVWGEIKAWSSGPGSLLFMYGVVLEIIFDVKRPLEYGGEMSKSTLPDSDKSDLLSRIRN